MNVTDLTDRVRRLTGIRMPEILSDDQILQLLNESYREIMTLTDWPFLYVEHTATINDGLFETRPVFRVINSAVVGEHRLRETTLNDIESYDEPEADPFAYARVDSNRFRVWPAPANGTQVHLRGVQSPPELYDPSDEPVFDNDYHVVIAYAASSRALAEEADDSGRTQAYMQEAGAVLDRMRMRYIVTHDKGIFKMGGKRSMKQRWRTW
jgi:hypothetical protein